MKVDTLQCKQFKVKNTFFVFDAVWFIWQLTVKCQQFLNICKFVYETNAKNTSINGVMDYNFVKNQFCMKIEEAHGCNICFIIKSFNYLTFWNALSLTLNEEHEQISNNCNIRLIFKSEIRSYANNFPGTLEKKDGTKQRNMMGEFFSQLFIAIFSTRMWKREMKKKIIFCLFVKIL